MAVQIPTDFVEGGGVPAAFAGAGHIAEQIELYQSQGDLYSKKIEIEKRRVAELDTKLKQSKSQLAEARKSMGGLHDAEAQMRKKRRQVRILENKLEKLIVRYNEATSRNEKLRTNIEDLRREKIQRRSIEDERKQALHKKKLELVEIIQQTQRAMEARDEARQNIVQLKKQIADEVGVFEREWQTRLNKLETDRRAYNEQVKEARLKVKREGKLGRLTKAQEASIKNRSTKAYWAIAKKEVDLEKQAEKILTYKEAFAKIKRETGINTIQEMVQEFVSSEDQNFALFNQIQELHREIEVLEVENTKMRSAVDKYKNDGAENDMAKNNVFSTLMSKISAAERQAAACQSQYEEAKSVIEQIKPGLEELFKISGCANSGALGQQLEAQRPTESNLLQYLGMIEQRVNEMAQLHKMKKGLPLSTGMLSDVAPPTPLSKRRNREDFAPRLPVTGEYGRSDDEDDDENEPQPMSIAEMRERTAMAIQAEANRAQSPTAAELQKLLRPKH